MSGTAPAEERVTVVYCGGCNPHIDRGAVAAAAAAARPGRAPRRDGAAQRLRPGLRLGAPAGRVADRGRAPAADEGGLTVVVAGELVNGEPTPAADLAAVVTRKLKE